MIRKYSVTFSREVKKHLEQRMELKTSAGFREAMKLPAQVIVSSLHLPLESCGNPFNEELIKFLEDGSMFFPYHLERTLPELCRMSIYISFYPISVGNDALRVGITLYGKGGKAVCAFAVMYNSGGKVIFVQTEDPKTQGRIIESEETRKKFYYSLT
jgi:hypothetical protein